MEAKRYLNIEGIVTKNDGSKINESEVDYISDSICEFLHGMGYCFGGGFLLMSEKEIKYFKK